MDKAAIIIQVSGKVQGVFYRQSTLEKAISLSINGWVKNNKDGTVEMLAEGSPEALSELINWCKKGPKNAVVTKVEDGPAEWVGYSGFKIIR